MSTIARAPLSEEIRIEYSQQLTLTTSKPRTKFVLDTIPGNLSLSIGVGSPNENDLAPFVGDEVEIIFMAVTTETEILEMRSSVEINFATGFQETKPLQVRRSRAALAKFKFDGTAWIETNRDFLA